MADAKHPGGSQGRVAKRAQENRADERPHPDHAGLLLHLKMVKMGSDPFFGPYFAIFGVSPEFPGTGFMGQKVKQG